MKGIASHSDRGDPAAVAVVDLSNGRPRDRESGLTDEFVDLVDASELQSVVDGGEEQLLERGRVVGSVLDEFLQPGRDMGHIQSPKLVVIDAGKNHFPASSRA